MSDAWKDHVLETFEREGGEMRLTIKHFDPPNHAAIPYLAIDRVDSRGRIIQTVAFKREELSKLREVVGRTKSLLLGAEETSEDARAQAFVGITAKSSKRKAGRS